MNNAGYEHKDEAGREQSAALQASEASRKKRKQLWIWLVIGGVLLAALAAVCFFVFAGEPITGQWYNEDVKAVVEFSNDGTATSYMLGSSYESAYTYSKISGKGTIEDHDLTASITVEGDTLKMSYVGYAAEYVFTRAEEGFDAKTFLTRALAGTWSNREIPEVVELYEDGKAIVHTISGSEEGVYDYDMESGACAVRLPGVEYTLYYNGLVYTDEIGDYEAIYMDGVGEFMREEAGVDAGAFLSENYNPLVGDWYDTEGMLGMFTFYYDGTAYYEGFNSGYGCTYSFDNDTGAGSISSEYFLSDLAFTLNGEAIEIYGSTFTRQPVEQAGSEHYFDDIAGVWYDTGGTLGTVEISADGTAQVITGWKVYHVALAFNPFDGTGTLDFYGYSEGIRSFSLEGETLNIDGTAYSRSEVAQAHPLAGAWHSLSGGADTLTINADGSVEWYDAGRRKTLYGVCTFDVVQHAGAVTFSGTDGTADILLS
ncbi:MAG: hypothetical protein AAGU77_10710, partial [Bacillota bacterium]